MGYQATFLARKRYAASDINNISTSLSLSPSSFTDETAYGVSDLNSITSSLVTAGVSSGCDVIKVDDTKLKVNTGTLFFSNGCRIDIDSDGVFLQYNSGEKYIYAFYDSAESGVSINIADSLPESGDFVPLAKYDGTDITDLRTHAKAKVTLNAEGVWNKTQTYSLADFSVMIPWNTTVTGTIEIDIQGDDFNYLIAQNTNYFGIYDIKAQKYRCLGNNDNDDWKTNTAVYYINTYSTQRYLRFKSLEYGKLKLEYEVENHRSSSSGGNTEAKLNNGGDVYITLT